jgi:hypothetical protein
MQNQIDGADFVLVVCTETYKRRVEGHETAGRGLGATWEGALITQSVYDNGGRNTKFIPVLFGSEDAKHIPIFLAASTRYDVSTEEGYEALYRLLTAQPAVLKPAVGPVRTLTSPAAINAPPAVDDRPILIESVDAAVVIWRLPRGFMALSDLQDTGASDWATIASYADYAGRWIQGTHYHESYRWWDTPGALENQYAKLGVPRGDWSFARAPLHFIIDVRGRDVVVSGDGVVNSRPGYMTLDPNYAYVCPPGPVRLPVQPPEYRRLVASGTLRDLMSEARDLVFVERHRAQYSPGDLTAEIRRLRREIRIEVPRRLDPQHPATKNVEEIVARYDPEDPEPLPWLHELVVAASEAAECIEEQSQAT